MCIFNVRKDTGLFYFVGSKINMDRMPENKKINSRKERD